MLYWSDSISIGVKGLLLRKLRALLSTLGIVFGIAAVISMMSIGEGARLEAIEQIKLLGTNNIRIKRVSLSGERHATAQRRYAKGLTYEDAQLINKSLPGYLLVAPLKFIDSAVRFEGRQAIAQVVGTSSDFAKVTNFHIGSGRFLMSLDLSDTKNTCILGAEVKQELFGYRDALGSVITIGDIRFTVVGVMEPKVVRKGRGAVIKVRNINRDVYISITTALDRFSYVGGDSSGIDEIAIRVTRAEDIPKVSRLVGDILERKHRGIEDYEVLVPEELLAQAQRTQRLFNIVVGSIASISLLVGGIGIMNIMLANVSERTREIGIRRAIGATRNDILTQFLIETVLICLVGGAIGVLLGFGIAKLIAYYANWATAFSLVSVIIAFGASALVGLIFGLFPARRAVQLDPVQALRFE